MNKKENGFSDLGHHHPLEGLEAPPWLKSYQPATKYLKYITPQQYYSYCFKTMLSTLRSTQRLEYNCIYKKKLYCFSHSLFGIETQDGKTIIRMRIKGKVWAFPVHRPACQAHSIMKEVA